MSGRHIFALSLAGLLLLGGCSAQSAKVPEETGSQEAIDRLNEKYGLMEPSPTPPPQAWDWFATVHVYLPDGTEIAIPSESPFSFEQDGVYWTLSAEEWEDLGSPASLSASIGGSDLIEGICTEEKDGGMTVQFPFDAAAAFEEYQEAHPLD